MAQILQAGSFNQLALGAPKAVVAVQKPSRPIVGVQTNILGLVGLASWGPVGVATVLGGNDEVVASFGPVTIRKYDISTAVAVAAEQFCSSFKAVRVTDGTDVAASGLYGPSVTYETVTVGGSITNGDNTGKITISNATLGITQDLPVSVVTADTTTTVAAKIVTAFNASILPGYGLVASPVANVVNISFPAGWAFARTNGSTITFTLGTASGTIALTLTAKYTGTVGNTLTATLQPGTAAGSLAILLNRPGYVSEKFDNITGAGNLLWVNAAAAINNGNSPFRGPSVLMTATAGTSTAVVPVTAATVTLTLGTDGTATVTDATLLGVDTIPRTGLYALRNQGVGVAAPVDCSTTTYWTNFASFGEGEGVMVEVTTASADTVTNAATELSGAGVDSYALKVDFGDWVYWYDEANGAQRLLSPATFLAAKRANLSPEQSVLNKPVFGVIGTQKSASGGVWSDADRDAIYSYRMDLLANPSPGGSYWSAIGGINASSNGAIRGDNYTMMTNFIARSVADWAGSVIGQLQTPDQRKDAKAICDDFFNSLWVLGMIGNADSAFGQGAPPWSVRIDDTTTPPALAEQGYEIAQVRVQYLAVIRYFIVNLMGGQTVRVAVSPTPASFAR